MKNAKRWLAILLAVTLLCSNGVSQLGMIVSASELETTEEAQPKEDAVVEQAEETKEDTGKATVEGVTPEEERGESSAQDAETANVPKAAAQEGAQEGQNEANVPEADPAAVVPVTANPATGAPATAAPVSEGAAPAEEAPAPEVQTYNVKINKSELGGGQIKVWGSDNNKVDVTEYDGNNQYVKEVKEGEEFNFQITLNDGFEIAQVKVNGNALDPANTEGNVITYKVAGINEEKVIDVTYNKVETPAEEKVAEEPKTEDETKVEEPAVEDSTATVAVTATGEIMTDFYVKADRSSVTVGDTVNVKAIIKPDEFSDKRVTWESSDETIATVDENGLVTTRAIGTVRITGKSEANPDMTDFDIITVNPIQVSKITITGYAKEYMLPNETVKLDATVEPDNAADKSVIWTSSDETIATVDQNGNVNALKQGEVTIRVAANDASGKYAEQKIKVYDAKPQEATVQVWVTNQYRGISYTINIPADGTEVNASDVIQKVDGYVSTNIIRVGTWESGSTWSTIQKTNPVQKFRYNNNRIQYTTNGYLWSNVSSNKIVAFYAIKTTAELGNTDVGVAVGDWPYGPGEATSHKKQTIRIKIVVDGSNNEIYNSGLLRYDNRSNGEYGKIEFDCDESRYEIKEILVYKNDSGTGIPLKTYTSVPTGGISVKFTDGGTNHYLVKAVVKPKEFDVTYDINGGEGKVPASTKLTAVDGQQVTVATSPQPTKEGYIFAGWEYDGTTYYGGESFEMPPHNVTFKAKWLKTSGVITYSSNNEEWGTVSRSYETLKDGSTETRGSVAKANEGCVFAGWKNNQTGEIVSNELIYKPIAEPGSYTAVFKANINKYLELKTNDVTAKYDGKDYATGTATVKDKATGKVADDVTIKYQKADGSWTTNPSEITATNVSDSKTVQVRATSEKYTGELIGTEKLTITPKPVTVTANSYNKAYGATDPEFTAKVEGTLGSDTVNYKLNRETGEDVGTYKILAIGDAAQGNYSVTYYPGTLTITAATRPEDRQLGVTSYEGVYDANEHTITVDNVLDGDVVEYSYDGGETWTTNLNQYKDVTETTIKVRVTNANYDPSPVELEGTVKITPKPVTVTANSYNKAYGATDPTFTAKVEGTLGTDAVNYILNRETGENVGTYKILAIGDATQGNYSVTYYPGTLTITASTRPEDKQLSVTSYEGVYDANDHTITVNNVLDGDVVEYSYDGGETWTTNLNQYKDVTETTIKVRVTNANYDPSPVELEGTVKITPKPVTVTANSDSKTYGAADPEFTAIVVGTLGTDKVTYNLSREAGEDVGTYPITASGDATQGNYNVTYHPGTLTITASTRPEDKQLSVTSYEGVYDANDHTITVNNVLDGDVVEYSYDGGETWTTNLNQYKDVTETTIKVRVTNANYDPSPVELEGTVKITPKPVTVTANSYNKAYGATDPTFTAKVEGTLGTDKVTYNLSREAGEDVGTYPITASGDATQGNYSVTYYPGTLTITAATRPEDRQLSVTSYEGVYDANEHTITVNNVLDGDVVEYSYDGGETWTTNLNQYKDVTETTIKVRVTNANYDPNPVELEGTVKITPKPVTVTANSDSKTYGASDPEFTATVEGTLGSDTVSYKLNRETGEDVGTYKILAIGDATQGNYSVTYYPGKLTITAATRPEDKQLSVTSYEGVYDANDHTITVDNVLDGDVVEYSYDGGETWTTNLNQYKDVTETTIKVRVTNANYDPNPVELEGTVKITPATLTVSTPTDTKVYEGTPLTAAGTINGFVNGETATFTTTGSQTEVGSTANTYSLTWDGTAKESNYTVAEAIGTLTVTAQSIDPDNPNYKGITVDAPTDVEYTGADQTWLPTVTDGNGKALVKDTDYTVTYDNEDRTNVTGTITVTINGAGNYAGTITREYQITPKPVTITTESKTKAFDGTALTAGGKVEGIVSGETYGFEVTGSQTYVGSSQNTYEMVWADSEVEGTSGTYTAKRTNYTVTENIGTLAVTAGTPENPLDPTLVVNKTHDKSQTYKAGDVITFTITAKNIYEEAKTITLEELEGVALDANVFENVAPGAEVTATATYTVTEQDIVNGTFTNNVTVTFSGVDDKFTGTDTVDELEDANPHMTITKTTVGADAGHIYKLGEVINYKITATNDGNLTLTNVKVEDALTGNVGENAFTIDTLAPGEAQTFDVRYVVTENDVLAGKVINNATGTATDPTDPDEPKTPVTPGEKEDPIETPNPSLAVVKTSDKTGVVKLGETITYTITVTNNGNVTINDIEVTDELTGNTGDNAFTIDRLAVGETKQFTATYTVTEDDILEGTIVNRATATGKDPRNEEVTGDGEVRVDTEEKDDSKKDDSKKDDSKKDDSKKNDSDKKPGAVKTGDATDVIPFFGMTVLAAGAAIVIALKKKRRA